MIRIVPPQAAQVCKLMPKTRFTRCAQRPGVAMGLFVPSLLLCPATLVERVGDRPGHAGDVVLDQERIHDRGRERSDKRTRISDPQ